MGDLTTADNPTPALERFKAEAWPLLPSLLRVARMLTRDEHHAEDLVQETMLRAYRHIATFQPGTNMKAWLMTILRRTHIDLHRKASRRVNAGSLDAMELEPADPAADAADDSAWAHPQELLGRFDDDSIEQALRELPEAMCWTLLLVDVEQMPASQAAEVLGVPAGTVKSRASRARAQLRALLLPLAQRRGWIPRAEEGSP